MLWIAFVILWYIFLAASPLSSQNHRAEVDESLGLEDFRSIASSFFFAEEDKSITNRELAVHQRTVGSRPLKKVQAQMGKVQIEPHSGQVIAWSFRNLEMPSETPDGRLVTREIFLTEIARLSSIECAEIAERFIRSRYHDIALENADMSLTTMRLGPGFLVRVDWRDRPNEEMGVHLGSLSVGVLVNPIDGEVVSGNFFRLDVRKPPMLTVGKAREAANRELQRRIEESSYPACLAQHMSVESIRVLDCGGPANDPSLVWVFNFAAVEVDGCTLPFSGLSGQEDGRKIEVRVADVNGKVANDECSPPYS